MITEPIAAIDMPIACALVTAEDPPDFAGVVDAVDDCIDEKVSEGVAVDCVEAGAVEEDKALPVADGEVVVVVVVRVCVGVLEAAGNVSVLCVGSTALLLAEQTL